MQSFTVQKALACMLLCVALTSIPPTQDELGSAQQPLTPELAVVQDADRLDAMGAIGIARCFTYGGRFNRVMHDPAISPREGLTKEQYMDRSVQQTTYNHFHEKLLKLGVRTAPSPCMSRGTHLGWQLLTCAMVHAGHDEDCNRQRAGAAATKLHDRVHPYIRHGVGSHVLMRRRKLFHICQAVRPNCAKGRLQIVKFMEVSFHMLVTPIVYKAMLKSLLTAMPQEYSIGSPSYRHWDRPPSRCTTSLKPACMHTHTWPLRASSTRTSCTNKLGEGMCMTHRVCTCNTPHRCKVRKAILSSAAAGIQ